MNQTLARIRDRSAVVGIIGQDRFLQTTIPLMQAFPEVRHKVDIMRVVDNYGEMLGGSILVIVLALVVDGGFAIVQRVVVPAGVRAARTAELRPEPTRPRATMGQPITEGNQQ